MSSTHLVISRLQNQRSRIQGMLSPGKKQSQPGTSLNASLSPVAADFAGRKFQLAARKMRTLDAGKLGQTLSGELTSLSTDIQRKFADIQQIVHINPVKSHDDSIWSSVETPLPDTQSARQVTSLEPGVMRSGSVIQKMNMVPKPGQSLDSFKDQVQNKPRATKSPVEKKPLIAQNTRRFSRVQEVTPGQKLTPPEIPDVPVKPDEALPRGIQTRHASETPAIQPQPDPSASLPEKKVITPRAETPQPESPVEKIPPIEMPLRQQPQPSLPDKSAQQHTTPKPRQSDSQIALPAGEQQEVISQPGKQVEQPSQAPLPARQKEIIKALPVAKKPSVPAVDELKKALPVKKEQKEPQKLVARPTLKSRTDTPAATARPVIQRQPDADLPPSAPVRPVIQQKLQTTSSPELPAPPAPSPQVDAIASVPEMPLQQNIDYRKNASSTIRAIDAQPMKPAALPPLIHREDAPFFTRSKYRPTSPVSPPPELSTKKDPSPLPKQDQRVPPIMLPDALPKDFRHNQPSQATPLPQYLASIPMPLAPQLVAPSPVKPVMAPEPAISPVRPQVTQISPSQSGVPSSTNTVQRSWEGHSPPSESASDNSEGSNARSESTDLESLAENVFPFVKRILEIEADRSSGKLR